MSLYLTELKIKTALELADSATKHLEIAPYSSDAAAAYDNIKQLRKVLREIIDRPKETENG